MRKYLSTRILLINISFLFFFLFYFLLTSLLLSCGSKVPLTLPPEEIKEIEKQSKEKKENTKKKEEENKNDNKY